MTLLDITLAFATIFFAEFMDKTQLLVILLASKFRDSEVFIGAVLALVSVAILSAFMSIIISAFISEFQLNIIIGFSLVIAGLLMKSGELESREFSSKNGIIITYASVFLAELGDKTQIAVLTLGLKCTNIVHVLIGVALAFIVITFLGVKIGESLRKISKEKRRVLDLVVRAGFVMVGAFYLVLGIIDWYYLH